MKSFLAAFAMLFLASAVLPQPAFARTQSSHAQTHKASAKKSHKAVKSSAHKKAKKKTADGLPS